MGNIDNSTGFLSLKLLFNQLYGKPIYNKCTFNDMHIAVYVTTKFDKLLISGSLTEY